jgi:hypothetical protein
MSRTPQLRADLEDRLSLDGKIQGLFRFVVIEAMHAVTVVEQHRNATGFIVKQAVKPAIQTFREKKAPLHTSAQDKKVRRGQLRGHDRGAGEYHPKPEYSFPRKHQGDVPRSLQIGMPAEKEFSRAVHATYSPDASSIQLPAS